MTDGRVTVRHVSAFEFGRGVALAADADLLQFGDYRVREGEGGKWIVDHPTGSTEFSNKARAVKFAKSGESFLRSAKMKSAFMRGRSAA